MIGPSVISTVAHDAHVAAHEHAHQTYQSNHMDAHNSMLERHREYAHHSMFGARARTHIHRHRISSSLSDTASISSSSSISSNSRESTSYPSSNSLSSVINQLCSKCKGNGWYHYSSINHIGPTNQRCSYCRKCTRCNGMSTVRRKLHRYQSRRKNVHDYGSDKMICNCIIL